MSTKELTLKNFALIRSKIGIPIMLLVILAMVILPLPPYLLDMMFTLNIVLAIMILVVSSSVRDVLEFSIFPTVLLLATLMRLTLNIASTRIVLLEGHNGPDAAGKVIQSFGEVVIGGNYFVGIVVFSILMIVCFLVISKGSERVSEVSARFKLDALPGKQFAIDADLNAGLIDQETATKRRKATGQETEFYAAMDGASKFVKNDAIAGIIILFINIIGGLLVGTIVHGLKLNEAFQVYVLLTIGDGLVAQIPSFLLAVSSAIIVTRVNSDNEELSTSIHKQILSNPAVLYSAAGVIFIIGSVPNMPHLPFFIFAFILAFAGWRQKTTQPEIFDVPDDQPVIANKLDESINWSVIPKVEAISINLGFKLVPMVTKDKNKALLKSIKGCRKTLSEKIGFVIPEVMVRDDLSIQPNEYVIYIDGDEIERGKVHPDRLMVVGEDHQLNSLDGIVGFDPAYHLPALWIEPDDEFKAIQKDLHVIPVNDVIATHLQKICIHHLEDIFNFDDVKGINERLRHDHPELMETLATAITPSLQMDVIRILLSEQVPITNIRTIANTIIRSVEHTKDPVMIASNIRVALKRTIMNLISPQSKNINVAQLGDELSDDITNAINRSLQSNPNLSLNQITVNKEELAVLQHKLPTVVQTMKASGVPPVLMVSPTVRPILSKLAKVFSPDLIVISFNEIPNDYNPNTVMNISR